MPRLVVKARESDIVLENGVDVFALQMTDIYFPSTSLNRSCNALDDVAVGQVEMFFLWRYLLCFALPHST